MKKIGLAIALGQDATLHTQTFLKAVDFAHYALTQGSQKIAWMLQNDHRSSFGGIQAAHTMELTNE